MARWTALVSFLCVCGLGWFGLGLLRSGPPWNRAATGSTDPATYARLTNSAFGPAPGNPHAPPELRLVPIPDFPGAGAIWGATGRDARGHIWIGVSADPSNENDKTPSAHVMEYIPDSGRLVDRGDVVSQLRRGGFARAGETQGTIHSRIIEGADGCLYFASMDEPVRENSDSDSDNNSDRDGDRTEGRPKRWGSHLWKLRPSTSTSTSTAGWEHLLTAPEGLIAVAGAGKHIYALGFFGHVLFHYDVDSGTIRTVRVGSVGRHTSWNLLCDDRGHAYVPRLSSTRSSASAGPSEPVVTLVEFDPALREVAETPIGHYAGPDADDSHGIVAFQYLADRSIAFATHMGFLYQVVPHAWGPAEVLPIGWFHPEGRAYVASMFTYEGRRYLLGASRRIFDGSDRYEWLVYDLQTRTSQAIPLEGPVVAGPSAPEDVLASSLPSLSGLLLSGSVTRDDAGAFYLAGRGRGRGRGHGGGPRHRPVLLRLLSADVGAPRALAEAGTESPSPLSSPLPSQRTPGPDRFQARTLELASATTAARAARARFRDELRRIVTAEEPGPVPETAAAIRALCERHGRATTPEAQRAATRALAHSDARLGRAERVNLMQACGLPETVILDYLTGLEARSILTPGGPQDLDEALVHAARQLLAIPLSPAAGASAAAALERTPVGPSGSESIRVACLGDGTSTAASYPALLQALLGNRFVVRNFSVPGATMLRAGDRPYVARPEYRDVKRFLPHAVLIMLGASDTTPVNSSHIDEDFAADCKKMIDDLAMLATRPRIFLCKPAPASARRNPGIDNRRLIESVIPIIESVARERELSLIDMYAALGGRPDLFKDQVDPAGSEEWMARAAYVALGSQFAVPSSVDTPARPAGPGPRAP
jgi:hypothetical protein